MPFVIVRRDARFISDELIQKRLSAEIRRIVAQALSSSESKLEVSDIQVEVRDVRQELDIVSQALSILVLAHNHSFRERNLPNITAQIADHVRAALSAVANPVAICTLKGSFVAVMLAPMETAHII